ncbi:hypothetical protein TNCV_4885741 [Trichonephila clavipes]|uniref:Uncharacterized protein n=1 Tax=Trichonephila clavipes TaxID=2585209 RepID=A0A8X6RIJ3_TRICX|nr:hypothetical protein TNCV_4885741 [Trichonephila clavipes]
MLKWVVKNSDPCSQGLPLSVYGWKGLRTELVFRFPRIQDDSESREDSPIMSRKRSRALKGRETTDERKC